MQAFLQEAATRVLRRRSPLSSHSVPVPPEEGLKHSTAESTQAVSQDLTARWPTPTRSSSRCDPA